MNEVENNTVHSDELGAITMEIKLKENKTPVNVPSKLGRNVFFPSFLTCLCTLHRQNRFSLSID